MLYFAYGSNLSHSSMAARCPKAKPLQALTLKDARLVFRGVADVEYYKDHSVQGGIWQITAECERSLDIYEGVKAGLYRKTFLTVKRKNREPEPMLVYQMNEDGIMEPSEFYLNVIRQGYRDFGLDLRELEKAVRHAKRSKRITPHLESRRARGRTGGETKKVIWTPTETTKKRHDKRAQRHFVTHSSYRDDDWYA